MSVYIKLLLLIYNELHPVLPAIVFLLEQTCCSYQCPKAGIAAADLSFVRLNTLRQLGQNKVEDGETPDGVRIKWHEGDNLATRHSTDSV